jgi:hypothetical protein
MYLKGHATAREQLAWAQSEIADPIAEPAVPSSNTTTSLAKLTAPEFLTRGFALEERWYAIRQTFNGNAHGD